MTLSLLRGPDGRLVGTVTTGGRERAFSGTLDLLRVLEDLGPEGPAPARDDARPGAGDSGAEPDR